MVTAPLFGLYMKLQSFVIQSLKTFPTLPTTRCSPFAKKWDYSLSSWHLLDITELCLKHDYLIALLQCLTQIHQLPNCYSSYICLQFNRAASFTIECWSKSSLPKSAFKAISVFHCKMKWMSPRHIFFYSSWFMDTDYFFSHILQSFFI